MYVGPGQANSERDILSNRYGSARYAAFLNGKLLTCFRRIEKCYRISQIHDFQIENKNIVNKPFRFRNPDRSSRS